MPISSSAGMGFGLCHCIENEKVAEPEKRQERYICRNSLSIYGMCTELGPRADANSFQKCRFRSDIIDSVPSVGLIFRRALRRSTGAFSSRGRR